MLIRSVHRRNHVLGHPSNRRGKIHPRRLDHVNAKAGFGLVRYLLPIFKEKTGIDEKALTTLARHQHWRVTKISRFMGKEVTSLT